MYAMNPMRRALGALLFTALLAGPVHATGQSSASAPDPVGPFMVFFDRGSSMITPQAEAILDTLAYAVTRQGHREIFVAGHTDGAETGRDELSFQRAVNVRAYLVQHGVTPSKIALVGFGFTRPLVETEESEPQNRRVEIVANP